MVKKYRPTGDGDMLTEHKPYEAHEGEWYVPLEDYQALESKLDAALAELAGARCLASPDGRCQIRRGQEFAGSPLESVSFPAVERGVTVETLCTHDGSRQHTTGDEWVRCTRCGAALSRAPE